MSPDLYSPKENKHVTWKLEKFRVLQNVKRNLLFLPLKKLISSELMNFNHFKFHLHKKCILEKCYVAKNVFLIRISEGRCVDDISGMIPHC